jgi:hypothetical protein
MSIAADEPDPPGPALQGRCGATRNEPSFWAKETYDTLGRLGGVGPVKSMAT